MKPFRKLFDKFSKDDNGAVLIIVALLIVVMMGVAALALDGGSLYQARRQMVNAADAAALAGAQELIRTEGDETAAEAEAIRYANQINGADQDKVTVEFPNAYTIVVEVGKQVDFYFAPVLGIRNSDVPARAVAVIGATTSVEGIIPIALAVSRFWNFVDNSDQLDIVNFEFEFGAGNRNWVSFTGTGSDFNPNMTAEYLETGYPGKLKVGDPVQTDTGAAMIPAMQNAINYHIDNHTDLYMPIISDEEIGQGTYSYDIVGFAAVRLTRLERVQGTWYLWAELLDDHIYPSAPSLSNPNFGLHSITLISDSDVD